MQHRGPDDEGLVLIDSSTEASVEITTAATMKGVEIPPPQRDPVSFPHSIGLGHRRFALVDTGPQGHQPFWDRDRLACLTWNGEIYNYVELRHELAARGHRFATSSDTEVFLAAYREWGVNCFDHFIGFWAAALFDAIRHSILLSRDRVGKAPLYFCRTDSGTYWASEINALRLLVAESRRWTVRDQSVVDFLNWNMRDMDGTTFFNEVTTFPAASFAWVEKNELNTQSYWRLPETRLDRTDIRADEAAAQVRETLGDAIRIRLRADVPVGVQVSGGLDSSSILAIAADQADRIDAYTVAFPQPEANEEPFARAVADRHKASVDYHVLSPPGDDHLARLEAFVPFMGEPFHSPNQITNHAIWETIRSHGLRGVLYGAGGDEVFAGYPNEYGFPYLRWLASHGRLLAACREFGALPATHHANPVKNLVIRGMLAASPTWENRIRSNPVPSEIDPFTIPRADRLPTPAPADLEDRLKANITRRLIPYWTRIDNQNSMGVPIELRCPFLDHRVVELGFRLPVEHLIHRGWNKWILREALKDELPEEVTWRRQKMGFPFPLRHWLGEKKKSLLDGTTDCLCPYLDHRSLDRNYDAILETNPQYLWTLLSVGLWSNSIRSLP